MSNLKNIDFRRVVLLAIGLLCIGIAAYGLLDIAQEYKKSDDTYSQAEEEFVQVYEEPETTEEQEIPWYELISVDLVGLKQINPEVIAWLYFEDGAISYPVMQAEDNDKYLHITFDGQEAKAGSIFMDAAHNSDFSGTHTILYGHNMKNLSMFGSLKYYKTKEGYYDGREYFQIHKGDEILRYQIFAYKDIEAASFIYQENFISGKELSNRLLERSYLNPHLKIEDDDKIITLSTCTADSDHRFVLSGVLIERYSFKDKVLIEELDKE